MTIRHFALATALIGSVVAIAPAHAVDTSDPAKFVDTLTDEGFAALRSGNRSAAKTQFRTLLSQHFAVDAIGDRLIRRWAPKITPAQRTAYKAAFPNFIIGTYADRLFDYSRADLRVVRAIPSANGAKVMTVVTKPGSSPVNAEWTLDKVGGAYKVSNLTVAGVNLSLTQAADFDAVIQRQGFDALVALMKKRS